MHLPTGGTPSSPAQATCSAKRQRSPLNCGAAVGLWRRRGWPNVTSGLSEAVVSSDGHKTLNRSRSRSPAGTMCGLGHTRRIRCPCGTATDCGASLGRCGHGERSRTRRGAERIGMLHLTDGAEVHVRQLFHGEAHKSSTPDEVGCPWTHTADEVEELLSAVFGGFHGRGRN